MLFLLMATFDAYCTTCVTNGSKDINRVCHKKFTFSDV